MKATIAIIAATVLAAASAPAFAQAEGSFDGAKVTYNAKKNAYCFTEARTGSLIPQTECRSKAEWADAGLNIAHKPAVQLAQR